MVRSLLNETRPGQQTKELLPGLTLVEEANGSWRVEAANIMVLEVALGRDLLVAFCRCFAAFDRLMTVTDAMILNDKHVGRDSVRGERNFHTMGLFVAGLVYEFREGIAHLQEKDLAARLSDAGQSRWERLQEHCELQHVRAVSQIRNCLAFHLGEPRIVRRGVERLRDEGRRLVVARGERGLVETGGRQYDFASDVLLAGINVEGKALDATELEAAYTEIRNGHWSILGRLEDIFWDALQTAGADIAPLQLSLSDADPPSYSDER